ncbi:hypothetical protein Bca52824_011178 [Brassica carinata]|uniref:CCHC-type domain-containing protein n=1 Tax=Brassica carinata TaxID=52824 RepID=A0A8X8BAV4_BRACI|nr:hypothetical protein Bca52824_011178 [Brassica carinata]
MWVHVKNVPLSMFSWQGLSFLTSPIGSPGRLHPETAQCLNLDVAKIFVNVDLTKDLPKKMNFNIQGENVMVEYAYPWLPTKCLKCDKWGHMVKACLKEKEVQKEQKEDLEEGEVEINKKENEGVEKEIENGEIAVVSLEVSDTINAKEKSKTGSKTVITQEEEDLERVKEWLTVSPGKSSRSSPTSQKGLEFGQVSILTKSRFAVLTPMEEQDELVKEAEEQIEEESLDVTREEEVIHRKMLPRESKVNHRYLKDKAGQKAQEMDPGLLNKKKPRRQ